MTKTQHKHLAMVAAKRVKACIRPSAKKKARKDCLDHLRASSITPPGATGESGFNTSVSAGV